MAETKINTSWIWGWRGYSWTATRFCGASPQEPIGQRPWLRAEILSPLPRSKAEGLEKIERKQDTNGWFQRQIPPGAGKGLGTSTCWHITYAALALERLPDCRYRCRVNRLPRRGTRRGPEVLRGPLKCVRCDADSINISPETKASHASVHLSLNSLANILPRIPF